MFLFDRYSDQKLPKSSFRSQKMMTTLSSKEKDFEGGNLFLRSRWYGPGINGSDLPGTTEHDRERERELWFGGFRRNFGEPRFEEKWGCWGCLAGFTVFIRKGCGSVYAYIVYIFELRLTWTAFFFKMQIRLVFLLFFFFWDESLFTFSFK